MDNKSEQRTVIDLSFPFGDEQVFRYRAMEDILELLIRNPFRAFTIRRLRTLTKNGSKTTTNAVSLLDQLDLVTVDTSGNSKEVSLDRTHVTVPDDPLFAIPQDPFRLPVRAFVDRAREAVPAFSALVVFGSVARGEADRQSDVDIWILVDDGDQLLQARRTATEIATELEEERFSSHEGAETAPQQGDRYEFEVLVESVETAVSYDEAITEILVEGIDVVDSPALDRVKDTVLEGQEVTS